MKIVIIFSSYELTGNRLQHDLYPGQSLAQAHPDRIATLAVLHGVCMPHPATSRILELGCGDGINLISVAQSLPEAMCVGIDLAEAGIKKGRAYIQPAWA